ncbi:MAG: transglycosylase domain-containing protein, partial [Pseudomonadota bacterium]
MGTRRTRGGHGSGMGRIEPHFGSGPAPGAEGAAPKPAKKAAKAPSRRSERRQKPAKKARRGNGSRQSGKTRGFSLFRFVRGSVYWGAVASVWVGILCAGVLAYYALTLPSMDGLAVPKRPPSLQIVAVDGTPLAQRGKMRGHAVSLNELPPYLTQAVLATEDARFYGHFGVDPIGLARAMVVNVQAGRVVQGGSTITQQLAKNLFLEPDRTIERKLQEVILAFWLERRFTKDEILEMYLNRVYLGAGAYGVEAAAQRYYSKSARAVNLTEAATLAGLLKAPSRFAPTRNPERAAARAKVVLARMVDEGYITNREGEVALALPAEVARKRTTSIGYVADIVAEQASAFVGELTEDVIVETTIDAGLQTMAERALVAVMAAEGPGKGAEQAALVAVDGIGAVRALVGGVNYRSSQFNRAVTAKRQPGSAFKPFVYLAALETGLSPETVRIDGPTRINGWAPQNYDGDFLGPISLTHGLSRSVNTIAARLANETGYETVARTAKQERNGSGNVIMCRIEYGGWNTTIQGGHIWSFCEL